MSCNPIVRGVILLRPTGAMRPSGAVIAILPRIAIQAEMTQRKRKLIGTIALLALIVVYALLALAVAIVLQVRDANKVAELIYYVVAGLLWVVPAAWLISWMQKPDA